MPGLSKVAISLRNIDWTWGLLLLVVDTTSAGSTKSLNQVRLRDKRILTLRRQSVSIHTHLQTSSDVDHSMEEFSHITITAEQIWSLIPVVTRIVLLAVMMRALALRRTDHRTVSSILNFFGYLVLLSGPKDHIMRFIGSSTVIVVVAVTAGVNCSFF